MEFNSKFPVKLLWVGRLEERKAINILLEAVKSLKELKDIFEIQIIGNGSQEYLLESKIEELKAYKISWLKNVKHDDIFVIMKNSDILIHTSYREATTNVIPEALSMGLPVICHKISGMDIVINDSCGIKIPLISPEVSIAGFAAAIKLLITDMKFLDNLKQGVKKRAMEISWDNIAEEIASDYIQIYNANI